MVKMMLQGQPAIQQTHEEFLTLKRYIDGWLYFKEKRKMNNKYEKYWFVLKGQVMGGGHLVSAFLFCFKDQNTHVKDHFVGSTQISFPDDSIELHKIEGNDAKPWKCDFVIKLNGNKMHFRANDNITRDRWIYALVDLVGRQLPPQELPTLDNTIRPRVTKLRSSMSRLPGKIAESIASSSPSFPVRNTRQQSMPNIRDYSTRKPSEGMVSPLVSSGDSNQSPSADSATLNGVSIQNVLRGKRASLVDMQRNHTIQNHTVNRSGMRHAASVSLPISQVPQPGIDNRVDVSWYYGNLGREQAETYLNPQPVGTYLLRDCQSKSGCFTLTYKDHDKKKNHMIMPIANGQYQFSASEITKTFSNPQEGVLYYMDMKKSKTFIPNPFVFRAPGDGAEEDCSYLQTDEINEVTSEKSPSSYRDDRPPMRKCPSLPDYQDTALPPIPGNGNMKRSVRRAVSNPPGSNTKTLITMPPSFMRKQSNIEKPTYRQHELINPPMRRAVSLDDYEKMGAPPPRIPSSNPSCSSILEIDDNAYLTGEEISSLHSSENDLPSSSSREDISTPYINSNVMSNIELKSPIRKNYNPPLPPIPDYEGTLPESETSENDGYLEMGPGSQQQPTPIDGYMEMGPGDNFKPEYKPVLPTPPPDYEGRLSTSTQSSDHSYLQMDITDPDYLMTDDIETNDKHSPDSRGYFPMGLGSPLSATSVDRQPHSHLPNRKNMVIPPQPKTPIKASPGSIRQAPPPLTYPSPLKKQPSIPSVPLSPRSPLSPKLNDDSYVNDVSRWMLKNSMPRSNNNNNNINANKSPSGQAPPPLPPRLAQPQLLPDQTSPTSKTYGGSMT